MPGNQPRPFNARWAQKRLSVFYVTFFALAVMVLLRLLILGVLRGEHYNELSQRNYLLTRRFDAPRGTIHDRNGEVLAFNRATFAVSMSRGNLTTATIFASLEQLEDILQGEYTEHYSAVANLRPRWKSRLLARQLTLDQATAVLEHRYNLPGVAVVPKFQRYYRHGSALCHVLGHVGKISPQRWNREDQLYQRLGYDMDDDIGVMGVEAAFEDALRGDKGLEQVWQSGRGRILSSNTRRPAVPGKRIYLTIDLELQQLAESLLLGRKGVILACDPRTGEMLVWASAPAFDLNAPMNLDDPTSQPQINRAIHEYYQPGSTFKIVTALAALEAGWTPEQTVRCERKYFLPRWDQPYRCLGWHGTLDLRRALKYSCNVYFYSMADSLHTGRDDPGYRLVALARHYGFGEPTQLGLHEAGEQGQAFGEKIGSLPRFELLQRQHGSLLHLAIGQGAIEVTPLQVLMAYAALANGGELLVPLLVREVRTEEDDIEWGLEKIVRRETGLDPAHRQALLDGMRKACYEPGGTAHSAGFEPNWRLAGKTSTAEHGRAGPADAWFVAIAPAEAPELVVLVMIEQGGHGGTVSAPLAARIFTGYFERKAARQTASASGQGG